MSRSMILPLAASILFLALGVLFIPLAGIQTDEALFGTPIYQHHLPSFFNRIIHLQAPLMVMTYLGTLKTYIYYPVLKILGVDVWTVRFPMVLVGALTVFIFYKLANFFVSQRAAAAGAFLLASDPSVVMTTTFDWGPVALEHLLLVTGCYCLCRFGRSADYDGKRGKSHERWLAGGFFLLGLALWNKAIFLWALTGLTVAAVATLWPFLRSLLSRRNVAIAAAACAIGAMPLILYNVKHRGLTIRGNTQMIPAEVPGKWAQLKFSLQGGSVFGYIAAQEDMGPPKTPQAAVAKGSAWLRERLGPRQGSGFYYVLGALLALFPLWWRSRAAWFSVVFCAVTWLMMAVTHDAGGSVHHVVLLWPFPILFAICALDGLPSRVPRWVLPTVAGVLVTLNLTVVNQYLYQLHFYGSSGSFTDAIFPLSSALDESAKKQIYVTDWGMTDSLNILHEGWLNMEFLADSLQPESPSAEQVDIVGKALQNPTGVFIGHLRGQEIFPNVGAHLDFLAQQAGIRIEVVQTISDSNGRPMFEISRAVPFP